ncbi:M23 family metallopeptidase [Asticcacaulis tiandongensis]|uniref:M23 family metallopeptidase n=1 Tax=Asticcacaulis tiandongensis TaxID=2565365 RepID=UPI001128F3BA|nr:M23 family metallopeptidase [Asticcacaulis tiandongensis]
MRAVTREIQTVKPRSGQWIAGGIGLVSALCLMGCTTNRTVKPQYPVYMEDRPASTQPIPMPTAPEASVPQVSDQGPAVTGTGSQGAITSTNLPPPPSTTQTPPPPPPPPTAATTQSVQDGYIYSLQAGDTLFGVSRRFGVPIRNIYQLNGLSADSVTRPGQKILLPATAVDKGVEERATGKALVKVQKAAAATPAAKPATPAAQPKPVVTPTAPATTTTTTTTTTVTPPAAPKPVTPAPAQAPKPAVSGAFPNQAEIVRLGKGRFIWPYKGQILVPFGQLATNVRNDGINIGGPEGATVVSTAAGSVIYVGDQMKELGNTIYIKHDDGFYSGYLHMASIKVKTGQKVAQGETIGTLGRTGAVDKPQLHFEIRYTPSTDIAKPIDPSLVLP